MYTFLNCPARMSEADFTKRLTDGGLWATEGKRLTELLLWFGFIGVQAPNDSEPLFAYQVNYDLRRLVAVLQVKGAEFAVNRAFGRHFGVRSQSGRRTCP